MTIYDEMRGIARDVLQEFNQGVVDVIQVTPGTGPKHNPGSTEGTPIRLKAAAVRGVLLKYVTGGEAIAGDLQVTMSPTEVFPAMNDFVEIDGERYKIVSIIPKPAAGTPVALVLIVRR